MIICDNFAVGHIPRTGGTTTYVRFFLCGAISPQRIMEVDRKEPTKHCFFSTCNLPEGHRRMLTLRRLPSWYLSWIAQLSGRLRQTDQMTVPDRRYGWGGFGPLFPKSGEPYPAPTMEEILGEEPYELAPGYDLAHQADNYIRAFSDYPIERIFRMESLENDLRDFFKEEMKWNALQLMTYDNTDKMSKANLDYDHDPYKFFSDDEMERLYENNPLWASMELESYGSLMRRPVVHA